MKIFDQFSIMGSKSLLKISCYILKLKLCLKTLLLGLDYLDFEQQISMWILDPEVYIRQIQV